MFATSHYKCKVEDLTSSNDSELVYCSQDLVLAVQLERLINWRSGKQNKRCLCFPAACYHHVTLPLPARRRSSSGEKQTI
jgi:hypothetical protein